MRELPTFYYHDHFLEFLKFIEGACAHLLHAEHQTFLQEFHQAGKSQQCLLVRCVNRKQPAIKQASLIFKELSNVGRLIEELIAAKWLRRPAAIDAELLLNCMTKDEIFELCDGLDNPPAVRKSMPKAMLVEACKVLDKTHIAHSTEAQHYIVRSCDDIIDYFLYLYFGNCKDRLNQFSMRDLGVMRTRAEAAQVRSRFSCKHEALSNFLIERELRRLRHQPVSSSGSVESRWLQLPSAEGEKANEQLEKLKFKLACRMLTYNTDSGVEMLSQSEHPDAQEKWCREAYKQGRQEQVYEKLLHILQHPTSDQLAYFAEDFLARKYHQKRTSIMTDMLRTGNQHLVIDEIYKGSVEKGVLAHYENSGHDAYYMENNPWRALFALTLWDEIFDTPGLGLATEFDYMPQCLKRSNLYQQVPERIDAKLKEINDATQWLTLALDNYCKNINKSQAIFSSRRTLIDQIKLLLAHSKLDSLKAIILSMAKDWRLTKDGFPDIAVVEENALRFEEIKGEGDSLRRNQLLRIQQMREAGFDVRLTTASFAIDPMQPYVVVDIETTGGRAGSHKITEIGMVKMINGEVVDRWQSLINPQRRIPANIVALTGITDDMVADAPLFSDVADDVDRFTENAIFVAHNVNFDYGFIREEFARLERHWRRPKLCTVQQMRRYFKGLPSYSLANLTKHFDISMQRHHRAMSDAVAASELLKLINHKRLTIQADAIDEDSDSSASSA